VAAWQQPWAAAMLRGCCRCCATAPSECWLQALAPLGVACAVPVWLAGA
jgi:hypothetical protein